MTDTTELHQSQLAPAENKFHVGNGDDGSTGDEYDKGYCEAVDNSLLAINSLKDKSP